MDTSELFGKTSEMLGGNLVMDWHPIQGGSSDTLSHAEETGILAVARWATWLQLTILMTQQALLLKFSYESLS